MKTLCQITAQYYENYGDSKNPYWKAKGGQIFNVYVDADDFFYSQDVAVEAIQELLSKQSDWHGKYEYLSYELIFAEPIVLSDRDFEKSFLVKLERKNQILQNNDSLD